MDKGEEVPQWAWDIAWGLVNDAEAQKVPYYAMEGEFDAARRQDASDIARAISQARSQAYEEIAAYVEGKGGNIPGAAVFAPLISRNRMPDMSGDPRERLSQTSRREFDDATRDLAQAILQKSYKVGET